MELREETADTYHEREIERQEERSDVRDRERKTLARGEMLEMVYRSREDREAMRAV